MLHTIDKMVSERECNGIKTNERTNKMVFVIVAAAAAAAAATLYIAIADEHEIR